MDKNKKTKSKIAIFNSLVNNPKMARILNEAVKADVGSTKKTKAKSILSIMNKVSPHKVLLKSSDGKGGPSNLSTNNMASSSPATSTNPSTIFGLPNKDAWSQLKYMGIDSLDGSTTHNTTIFPSIPAMKTSTQSVSSKVNPTSTVDLASSISNTLANTPKKTTINIPNVETMNKFKDQTISQNTGAEGLPDISLPEIVYNEIKPAIVPAAIGATKLGGKLVATGVLGAESLLETAAKTGAKVPITIAGMMRNAYNAIMHPNYYKPAQYNYPEGSTGSVFDTAGASAINKMWSGGDTTQPVESAKKTEGNLSTQNVTSTDTTKEKEKIIPVKKEEIVTNSDGSKDQKTTITQKVGTDKNESGSPVISQKPTGDGVNETVTFGDGTTQTTKIGTYSINKASIKGGGNNLNNSNSSVGAGLPPQIDTTDTGGGVGMLSYDQIKGYAQSYIDSGLGGKAFASDLAKYMLGDLGAKDAALQSALEDKYNLDFLKSEKMKYANAESTARQDMVDWVKSNDTYIKKLDHLNEEATKMESTLDMSDPRNANLVTKYKQYLKILKGRQTDSYNEYLEKDINLLKDDMTRTDNAYTAAQSAVQKAYSLQSGLDKDTYNETRSVLEDLYNTMEAAPGKTIDLYNKQATQYENMLKKAGISIDTTPWLKTAQENAYVDQIIDPITKSLKSGINLNGSIDLISSQGNNVNVNVPIYITQNGMTAELEGDTNITSAENKMTDYLSQVKEAYMSRVTDQNTFNAVGKPLISMGKAIIKAREPSVNTYIASQASNITKALQSLDRDWNYYVTDKNAWIAANKNVDHNILNSLYDVTYVNKTAPNGSGYSILDNLTYTMKSNPAMQAQSSSIRLANYISPFITSNRQAGWENDIMSSI